MVKTTVEEELAIHIVRTLVNAKHEEFIVAIESVIGILKDYKVAVIKEYDKEIRKVLIDENNKRHRRRRCCGLF